MPSVDEPRLDNRLPGYGTGPLFGMLGPSRVVARTIELGGDFAHLVDGVAMPLDISDWGEEYVSIAWFADVADCDHSFTIQSIGPPSWLVELILGVRHRPSGVSRRWVAAVPRWTWGFSPLTLSPDVSAWGEASVYRIAEWQTVSKRFPSVWLPTLDD
jgi:hypothetical protein